MSILDPSKKGSTEDSRLMTCILKVLLSLLEQNSSFFEQNAHFLHTIVDPAITCVDPICRQAFFDLIKALVAQFPPHAKE